MFNTLSLRDSIISLFVLLDDLIKLIPEQPKIGRRAGKKSNLSEAEILTLALLQHFANFRHKKACYLFVDSFCKDLFPNLPKYQNFVLLTNKRSIRACQILLLACFSNRRQARGNKFADSTSLPVCTNQRIFSHKVCKGVAGRSKTTKGWFYGFKLHITCDSHGNILSLTITSGNTDDRKVIEKLLEGISGLVIADAGYLSHKIQQRLFQKNIFYFTAVRNTMKKLMTFFQHQLLKQRQRVETVFSNLKERLGLVSSLSRSVLGHFARYLYACLAYCLQPHAKATKPLLPIS